MNYKYYNIPGIKYPEKCYHKGFIFNVKFPEDSEVMMEAEEYLVSTGKEDEEYTIPVPRASNFEWAAKIAENLRKSTQIMDDASRIKIKTHFEEYVKTPISLGNISKIADTVVFLANVSLKNKLFKALSTVDFSEKQKDMHLEQLFDFLLRTKPAEFYMDKSIVITKTGGDAITLNITPSKPAAKEVYSSKFKTLETEGQEDIFVKEHYKAEHILKADTSVYLLGEKGELRTIEAKFVKCYPHGGYWAIFVSEKQRNRHAKLRMNRFLNNSLERTEEGLLNAKVFSASDIEQLLWNKKGEPIKLGPISVTHREFLLKKVKARLNDYTT
jgi:hypothetical protein